MLKHWLFLGLLALRMSVAEVTEEEDVLVLTDDNFDEEVAKHDMLLVEFYAPWCGHCKSLAPEYAKAATSLKENDPPIRLAKVDATEASKVAEKYGVQGFPTLKLFKGSTEASNAIEYDGGRTADAIEQWMIKKSGPSVSIVTSVEEIDALKDENEVVIVAYLDAVDGDQRQVLEKVADNDNDNVYVATANAEVIAAHGVTVPALTLFKQFDEGVNKYEGELNEDNIEEFIKKNDKPLVMTFSQEKASAIFGGDLDVHLLMFSDEEKDYHKDLVEGSKAAATEHRGKMLHIIIPLAEDRILDYFGFSEEDLPAVVMVNMASGMKKYNYPVKADALVDELKGDFKDNLIKFEKEYFEGTLKPSLKSAEPVDDGDEAVKVIVGKDFKERVVEADKDVLLEFYAPWCGHCKNLAPKYEELGEKFAEVESILIAKMDSTENEIDHPGVNVQGFPTILFFPANDKENPVTYEGNRDVEGLTEFLKKNARQFDLDGEKHGISHDEL